MLLYGFEESCILIGRRAVRKTRIRTVVRKFPYSDRLFESSELATILTCFDKKKLQQFFSNTLKKKKKQQTKDTKYRRDIEETLNSSFAAASRKNKVNFKAFTQKRSHVKTCILNV